MLNAFVLRRFILYIYILLTPLIKIKKTFFLLDFPVFNIILEIMLILIEMLGPILSFYNLHAKGLAFNFKGNYER